MIRTLLFATLISASALVVAHPEKLADKLVLELGLDDTRAEQVKDILMEARSEAIEMKKAHYAQMSEHRETTRNEIAEILTTDEMAKFEELRSKKMKKMKYHGREYREKTDG